MQSAKASVSLLKMLCDELFSFLQFHCIGLSEKVLVLILAQKMPE